MRRTGRATRGEPSRRRVVARLGFRDAGVETHRARRSVRDRDIGVAAPIARDIPPVGRAPSVTHRVGRGIAVGREPSGRTRVLLSASAQAQKRQDCDKPLQMPPTKILLLMPLCRSLVYRSLMNAWAALLF